MTRQVRTLGFMVLAIVALGVAAIALQPRAGDGLAKVHMLNIGQGDSFLIEAANGSQMLIDGGRDASVLTELASVMPPGDRTIDVVLATHPDADHIGGLPAVLKRYQVGLFLTSDVEADTEIFETLFDTLKEKNIPSYYARKGMMLTLDDTSGIPTNFAVLFPDRDTTDWETNTASVVGRLQIGTRSALFTGDSPISIEQYLRTLMPDAVDVDILKIGHHGSRSSTSYGFLKATSPALALISAGVDNSYGHPHPEVMKALSDLGIPSISTQDKGTVTLTADGVKWRIEE